MVGARGSTSIASLSSEAPPLHTGPVVGQYQQPALWPAAQLPNCRSTAPGPGAGKCAPPGSQVSRQAADSHDCGAEVQARGQGRLEEGSRAAQGGPLLRVGFHGMRGGKGQRAGADAPAGAGAQGDVGAAALHVVGARQGVGSNSVKRRQGWQRGRQPGWSGAGGGGGRRGPPWRAPEP